MTIPRLIAIQGHFGESPPIHRIIQSYFGIKGKPKKEDQQPIEELIAMFGGGNKGAYRG